MLADTNINTNNTNDRGTHLTQSPWNPVRFTGARDERVGSWWSGDKALYACRSCLWLWRGEDRRRGRTSALWPGRADGRRLPYGGDRAVADELSTQSMNSVGD